MYEALKNFQNILSQGNIVISKVCQLKFIFMFDQIWFYWANATLSINKDVFIIYVFSL